MTEQLKQCILSYLNLRRSLLWTLREINHQRADWYHDIGLTAAIKRQRERDASGWNFAELQQIADWTGASKQPIILLKSKLVDVPGLVARMPVHDRQRFYQKCNMDLQKLNVRVHNINAWKLDELERMVKYIDEVGQR
ncbi:hypothetical protein ACAW74_24050 [Fibrella sp. WM1]|uniref:hypothetical protein n=1 Tax=Fibrella musci TaxID=3242485 RepID=UPI00351FEC16